MFRHKRFRDSVKIIYSNKTMAPTFDFRICQNFKRFVVLFKTLNRKKKIHKWLVGPP